jgi:hypothetical protein
MSFAARISASARSLVVRGLLAINKLSPDITPDEQRIIKLARPYTQTSAERLLALIHAVRYISQNHIPGDIVECGVWRGGSMIAVAATLLSEGHALRSLWLYDTYEGMTTPDPRDRDFQRNPASERYESTSRRGAKWNAVTMEEVRGNLLRTGYPPELFRFVCGPVESTIPANRPDSISLLRLDTDWYQSTKHELEQLFPLLQPNGVLIVDDYGHWEGARRAVDEFVQSRNIRIFLHRIDYTGRIGIKLPHG